MNLRSSVDQVGDWYGMAYRNALLPLYERARGRSSHAYFRQALRNQWKSADELREIEWRELKKLLDHAHANSPWHRARFEKLGMTPGDVRTRDDFTKLPPITKDDILEHRDEMLATDYRGRVYEHRTGGSTGTPLRFFVNRGSYEWRLAVSMRGYSWAGCFDGDRQFYVWGAPIGTPPWVQRTKVKLHNAVMRRRFFSSFGFSQPAMAECARQIDAFRPRTLVGYTNALYLLSQHILESKVHVARPDAVITAAEGVNSVQRETIERAFGAPVFDSYGSREFMLIGMECEQHAGLHQSVDNLFVEVIANGRPAADGEVGEVLVTDLHNWGMPFIRYRIGDLAVRSRRTCPCGRGLPIFERVEGRVLDAIRTPDGRIVPGEFFPHLMKEFDSVRQFQVVQKQLDLLHIRLVLGGDGRHAEQVGHMQAEIRRVLGESIQTQFEQVTEIAQTPSGKFRVTVSELKEP